MSEHVDRAAEAIVASMQEQCDFGHVGLISAHVDWKRVAQAVIDALQLTEERIPDIAGEAWGVHARLVGKSAFIPGPRNTVSRHQ